MSLLLGMDVGGTNLRLGVVDITTTPPRLLDELRFQADLSALCKTHQQTPDRLWQEVLTLIAGAVMEVQQRYPAIRGVGVGFPGFIDPVTHCIVQSPNFPGLEQVDVSVDLGKRLGLPVWIENDALAAAYGEYVMAQERLAMQSLIYLGLGTGVGGGLILQGQPWPGRHGVAMEVGHIIVQPHGRLCGCGNMGCMEQYASASGVAQSYLIATGHSCGAEEIAKRAQQGEGFALEAYALAGVTLAQALAHILKVIDVENVVIGGGMSVSWPLMEQAFWRQLEQDSIPAQRGKIKLHISTLGDQAGMIGAALLAGKD